MDYVDLSAHQAHSGNRRRTRVSHSGNRTSMVETPASGPAVTWAYAYDWLDRLTSVTKDSVLQSVYSYDESDNRIQLQMPVLGQTHSYAYDFADRIVSRSVGGSVVETFSHDADGNLIARTAGGVTTNYTWNDDNRLVAVAKSRSTTQYRYDSEGIRKSKGSDTRDFSSGAISLADLHPTNSISYVQGHQILGMIQAGSQYTYVGNDPVGSVDPEGLEPAWGPVQGIPRQGYWQRNVNGVNEYTNIHIPPSPRPVPTPSARPLPPHTNNSFPVAEPHPRTSDGSKPCTTTRRKPKPTPKPDETPVPPHPPDPIPTMKTLEWKWKKQFSEDPPKGNSWGSRTRDCIKEFGMYSFLGGVFGGQGVVASFAMIAIACATLSIESSSTGSPHLPVSPGKL